MKERISRRLENINTINLTDKQLAMLKSYLKYAYKVYTSKPPLDENVEMALLELINIIGGVK